MPRRDRFLEIALATARRAVLGAGLATLAACSGEGPRQPSVLLISIDSLRADHLGCYGYESSTGLSPSPTLDRLAAEGVCFENAVSTTSWTLPAHHALLSGLPDLLHGAVDDWHGPTPDRQPLPVVLRNAGYATAGYYSGPYLQPAYGFAAGFDPEDYRNVSGLPLSRWDAEASPETGERPTQAVIERSFHEAVSAGKVTDAAREFLRARQEAPAPFFLFLHYFDVHYDYVPPQERFAAQFRASPGPPALSGEFFMENTLIEPGMSAADLADVVSCYDGEIYWVDSEIDKLLESLDELGLREDTLVVVVADHGDEFFEHGEKGHRKNLYEPTLRVPLILRLPGVLDGGRRIPTRVSLVDVAPTILELALEEPPPLPPGPGPGRSLLPLVRGEDPEPRVQLGSLFDTSDPEEPVNHWALWTGNFKVYVREYWFPARQEARRVVGEVYDLARDPGEQHDLSASPDAAVRAAIREYEEVHERVFSLAEELRAGPPPAFSPEHRADTEEILRALGYTAARKVSEQPPPARFPGERP